MYDSYDLSNTAKNVVAMFSMSVGISSLLYVFFNRSKLPNQNNEDQQQFEQYNAELNTNTKPKEISYYGLFISFLIIMVMYFRSRDIIFLLVATIPVYQAIKGYINRNK